MKDRASSEARRQETMNSKLHAIEKARSRAEYVGESGPPEIEHLDEDLLLPIVSESRALAALLGKARIWDSGASKGMTDEETAVGVETIGPTARVHTGAGIVKSKRWPRETTPVGTMLHVFSPWHCRHDQRGAGKRREGSRDFLACPR